MTRQWLCAHKIHYPVMFHWDAVPGDGPEAWYGPTPPEPGWICEFCAELRMPYRDKWLWPITRRFWGLWYRLKDYRK